MGVQTIIHGRISLNGDFLKSQEFIKSLSFDDKYPWIRSEMFSLSSIESPYFYDTPIISFGASYKNLEMDFTSFIIKFENVLRNIEFDTAKIQMETEFYGTYNFFWKSKSKSNKFEEKDKIIETNEWYFGFGYRCVWGLLDEELKDNHIFSIDFEYPIKFDKIILNEFHLLLDKTENINMDEKIYLSDYLKDSIAFDNKMYPILVYYYTNKELNYGFEKSKGYWIEKLKCINRISSEFTN